MGLLQIMSEMIARFSMVCSSTAQYRQVDQWVSPGILTSDTGGSRIQRLMLMMVRGSSTIISG